MVLVTSMTLAAPNKILMLNMSSGRKLYTCRCSNPRYNKLRRRNKDLALTKAPKIATTCAIQPVTGLYGPLAGEDRRAGDLVLGDDGPVDAQGDAGVA